MLMLKLLNLGMTLSSAYDVLKGIYKSARGRVFAVKLPNGVKLPVRTWAQRFWAALLSVFMVGEVIDFMVSVLGRGVGIAFLGFAHILPSKAADAIETIANIPIAFEGLANRLAASTMNSITGLDISPDDIKPVGTPEEGRARAINIGEEFMQVVSSIFNIPAAAQDFQTRTGHSGSANNLAAYFGTNLFFQLRSLTISTVATLTGWHTLRHLESLHQSVNWAFGFGWLSWAVMSEFMNVSVNPGMRRLLNSQVKPNDYSEAEARVAYWSGALTMEDHLRIMDNQGVRDDIRGHLLDRAQANLSDAEMQQLWRHGRITESAINAEWKLRPYGIDYREKKMTLLKEERLWGFLDKISEQYLTLYRDCVVSSDEVRLWLTDQGWTDNEISAALALQELERRSRRFLSVEDTLKAYSIGLIDLDHLFDNMICQGYTERDAFIKLLVETQEKFPQTCYDKIRPNNEAGAIAALYSVLQAGSLFELSSGIAQLIDCLKKDLPDFPDFPDIEEKTPAKKLPSGSLVTLPSSLIKGEQFRLVWNIDRTDKVTIDNGIGEQPPQGVLFLTAEENMVWHLTAENEDGAKTFQASILVKPKPEEKAPKQPLPSVTFNVSPSATPEGENYTLAWSTSNADQVFLDMGNGPEAVAANGARIAVADRSRIFSLTASGPGGQRTRTDTLLVKAKAGETIKLPTASLAITPGQATTGERVEVRWSSANASRVRLEGIGGEPDVQQVGARIVVADHDRIVTLRASDPEHGTERTSVDALIVNPPELDPPPDFPVPSLSFTIRPSSTKAGETVALEWYSAHADKLTLQRASGTVNLDPVGATTIEAVENEIFIIRATGKGGQKAIAKVLLVKQPEVPV